jgi:hypothetical protein
MAKTGRPTLYKPEYDEQVYKLCLLGAKDKEIADFFDVDEATINRWKLEHQNFCESIKNGKVNADIEIAQSLHKRAKGYEIIEEVITKEGIQEVKKHIAPDPTSIIFWLKNRQPKMWRDKQEIDQTTTHQLPESYNDFINRLTNAKPKADSGDT